MDFVVNVFDVDFAEPPDSAEPIDVYDVEQLTSYLEREMLPYFESLSPKWKNGTRETLEYNLVRHSQPGDNTFERHMGRSFLTPDKDYAGFFRTIWDVLFPGEEPKLRDDEEYEEIDDHKATWDVEWNLARMAENPTFVANLEAQIAIGRKFIEDDTI